MTLVPETTAERINMIINDDSVRPWVCGNLVGVLDATILVNNKENIFFVSEHGGCGFIKKEDGVYELHSFALPSGRGRWVRDNFFKVRDWIFSNTNARMIVTLCPINNRMAVGAARMCKFKKYETIKDSWEYEGKVYDMDAYVLYKEAV